MWSHRIKLRQLSYRKPIVYAWFRGNECMYVGFSRWGLSRPLDRRHGSIGSILQKALPTDELRWIEFDSVTLAEKTEKYLVRSFEPKLNLGNRPSQNIPDKAEILFNLDEVEFERIVDKVC